MHSVLKCHSMFSVKLFSSDVWYRPIPVVIRVFMWLWKQRILELLTSNPRIVFICCIIVQCHTCSHIHAQRDNAVYMHHVQFHDLASSQAQTVVKFHTHSSSSSVLLRLVYMYSFNKSIHVSPFVPTWYQLQLTCLQHVNIIEQTI